MFEGAHTAIVTPFLDGKIDEPALRNLIDFQFDNKISGSVGRERKNMFQCPFVIFKLSIILLTNNYNYTFFGQYFL